MPATAVVVDAIRTPFGVRHGALAAWHPVDLLAHVLSTLTVRNDLDPAVVDDVITGCVSQVGEQALNVGRSAVLAAGFPDSVPATTVDRQCGSSQQALHFAVQGVAAGAYDVAIAAGVECMTRVPMGSSLLGADPFGARLVTRYPDVVPQGMAAERIVQRWGLTRDELDAYALGSCRRASRATAEARFDRELVPVPIVVDGRSRPMTADEGVRADVTMARLASMKPAFTDDGVITAGNSAPIGDGAAAVLVASEAAAARWGLTPRARVVATAVAAADPVLTFAAAIPATTQALARAGRSIDAVDRIEVHEGFASAVLAWAREVRPDPDRVNVNGGAIALGHPLGASGARLTATLVGELERSGARLGLQVMAEGGGQANATVFERW